MILMILIDEVETNTFKYEGVILWNFWSSLVTMTEVNILTQYEESSSNKNLSNTYSI